jgi:peptidoglycan/LPS O-acetylase OafA/YrhL
MSPQLSVYLDLVRFGAALVVLLAHLAERFFPGIPLPFPGKDAVIVFFVLSGFVVAYVADTKERQLTEFAISRYTRLVSVFFPAMFLCLLIGPVDGVVGWQSGNGAWHALISVGLNAFFLGQVWTVDITPPNDAPSWSLNYEAWYYLIFGIATFVRGPARWPAVALAALCAGPKILILMPCWIAGCLLYRHGHRFRLRPSAANLLFVGSLVAYAVYFLTDLNVWIRTGLQHAAPIAMGYLQWSNRFAGDYLLCLIVLANFVAARDMGNVFSRTFAAKRVAIKGAAGYTLSIYLYHMPLMIVFGAWLAPLSLGRAAGLMVAALLIPSIVILAKLTELRLRPFRAWVQRLIGGAPRRHGATLVLDRGRDTG